MNVLVDSSVWSLAFRRKPENLNANEKLIVAELRELIKEGRARIIGVVRQELLSGLKMSVQYEELRITLAAFTDEEVNTTDHEEAAKASNACRAKGIQVTLVDVLICAVSMSRGFEIFTTDPDFKIYSKVLPIQLHSHVR